VREYIICEITIYLQSLLVSLWCNMENTTIWSLVCSRASDLPKHKGWIRKTSGPLGLSKKAFAKDTYKLHDFVATNLNIIFFEVGEIIHFAVCNKLLNERCETCFDDYPNVHLNNIVYLVDLLQGLQEQIKQRHFSSQRWHSELYKDVQWAKETTIAQFIDEIVDHTMKFHVCLQHTDNLQFKRERLSLALKYEFYHLIDCLVLLTVSCNYQTDNLRFCSRSPFEMSTFITHEIFNRLLFVIYNINNRKITHCV
jgi:hypothetical protein